MTSTATRIGIVGSSLGGYYVARAAAFEPRLKAAVAWGAIYDYHSVWVRRMEGNGIIAAPRFQLMFITGTDTMEAAVEKVKDFRVADFAARIRCPFLVMHGAEDQQVLMDDAQRDVRCARLGRQGARRVRRPERRRRAHAVRQPPAGAAGLRRLDREETMKTAIVNLGTIVTGDWRDPFAKGDCDPDGRRQDRHRRHRVAADSRTATW